MNFFKENLQCQWPVIRKLFLNIYFIIINHKGKEHNSVSHLVFWTYKAKAKQVK